VQQLTRRGFIGGSVAAALAAFPAFDRAAGSERVAIIPFVNEEAVPLDTLYGVGLEGRRNTDLSKVSAESLRIESQKFFVRTRFPERLHAPAPWRIEIDGLVRKRSELALGALRTEAEDCGVHLIDCAGNTRLRRFGLLSEAQWQGVIFERLISRLEPVRGATRVQIYGYDRKALSAKTSARRGSLSPVARDASWVFNLEDLVKTRAFLATGMNGHPLLPENGASVRLVVPGWYGCVCTKWIDRIALVDDTAAATHQMKEYASRTNQTGEPALARDYVTPAIEPSAVPVRVEQWKESGRIFYRVVGVLWGGFRPGDGLTVRFHPELQPSPVVTTTPGTGWTLWTFDWKPAKPGTYRLELRIADASRSHRLSTGFYDRSLRIGEI
jgi:DMSO/TMAO reductase YedYZ molybdopterin-dependent catalytic subunit